MTPLLFDGRARDPDQPTWATIDAFIASLTHDDLVALVDCARLLRDAPFYNPFSPSDRSVSPPDSKAILTYCSTLPPDSASVYLRVARLDKRRELLGASAAQTRYIAVRAAARLGVPILVGDDYYQLELRPGARAAVYTATPHIEIDTGSRS